ncbi:MAG TPA: SEC-C domain-containing protein, partial [Thermoanaerobaculia bacterium]|nr:SEC-C domain-containing protein [Thermoanaerobaculia bacterium]
MSVGRNDPCPCGSGKKFKVCCLRLGRKAHAADEAFSTSDLPARFRENVASILSAGGDVATAEVRSAVALAGELCLEDAAADDELLRPCHLAFAVMSELIRKNGGGEEELVSVFLPRLPFDVVLDDEGRTAGDLLLDRYGAALPEPAREAVRALIEAEDTLCRVEKVGGRTFIEDLRTGTRLPAAEAFRMDAPGMTTRLVRYRGRHVPLDPELVDEPDDPWYADDLEDRFDHAEGFLKRFDLRLRSRGKGGGIGGELVELAFGQVPDTEGRVPDVRNAEGHRLVFTTLRWDVAWEPGVRTSLATVEGLELEETAAGLEGTFLKKQPPKARKMPGMTITVGALKLEDGKPVVETNSAERAVRLRKKLEKALGKTATFRSVASEPLEDALAKPVDPEHLLLMVGRA